VFIEAMACGLPVVAAASGGPLSFVNDDPTAPNGWLVTPTPKHPWPRHSRTPPPARGHSPRGPGGPPTPWHKSTPGSPGRAQPATSSGSTTRSVPRARDSPGEGQSGHDLRARRDWRGGDPVRPGTATPSYPHPVHLSTGDPRPQPEVL